MSKFLICICFIALMGCDHYDDDKAVVIDQASKDADQVATNVEKSGTSVATQLRENVKTTGEEFRSWLITPNPPKKPNNPIAASYCYRSLTDIMCYRQPVPGWEGRLIAYQGTNAPSPELAQTQPLAKRVPDPSVLPENKVANAKPVFKDLPPSPKEEEKNTDGQPVFDSNHEQLPNPLRSPQM